MDAQQADRVFQRKMEMTGAATRAATLSGAFERHKQQSQRGSGSSGSRFNSKILKLPDTFQGDDPVKFTLWQEQFMNWICFVGPRYSDAFSSLTRVGGLIDWREIDKSKRAEFGELAQRLYCIFANYLSGAASQVVIANSKLRNGFQVWGGLQALYLPSTRPWAMALGQAIIRHPPFHNNGRCLMGNLLQLWSRQGLNMHLPSFNQML